MANDDDWGAPAQGYSAPPKLSNQLGLIEMEDGSIILEFGYCNFAKNPTEDVEDFDAHTRILLSAHLAKSLAELLDGKLEEEDSP